MKNLLTLVLLFATTLVSAQSYGWDDDRTLSINSDDFETLGDFTDHVQAMWDLEAPENRYMHIDGVTSDNRIWYTRPDGTTFRYNSVPADFQLIVAKFGEDLLRNGVVNTYGLIVNIDEFNPDDRRDTSGSSTTLRGDDDVLIQNLSLTSGSFYRILFRVDGDSSCFSNGHCLLVIGVQ